MDILLQIIGYSFIPLFGILIIAGAQDIYFGLKEHYGFRSIKILEIPVNAGRTGLTDNLIFQKFEEQLCKTQC